MHLFIKNFKYSLLLLILLIPLFYSLLYSNIWNIFIGNSQIIFGDLKLNIHWLKCDYQNFKVYEDNSCNLFRTNYGPSLFFIPFNETLENFYLNYFPYIIYLVFLSAIVLINNPKNLPQSVILFIILFNPAVFLLLERMNFDVYILLFLIFIVYNKVFFLNWIIIIFLGLTKIYPFILGISIFFENLRRSKRMMFCIFLLIAISSLTYVFLNFDKYLYVLTSGGAKAGLHLLFSIKSFSKILKYQFDINYILSLPIILFFFIYLIKKIINQLNQNEFMKSVDLESKKVKLFILSGLTISLCYVFFSNYLYREAFFVLLMPFLSDLLFNKKIFLIKILLYLFLIKFSFQYVYGYFNVVESFYHIDNVRYYSNSFLIVSFIKGVIDFIVIAFISSITFIMIKQYYNKIKSINY
jgi:hypothetical protein